MASVDTSHRQGACQHIHIHADGCLEPGSGTGGWAFVAYREGVEIASEFGRVERSSNNAMELIALLAAARWASVDALDTPSILWSDSVYAVNGCNRWRHVWKNWGWRKTGPNPNARSRAIADKDLWIEIDGILSKCALLEIAWCKGHSGILGNERADRLAEFGRTMPGATGRSD